MPGLGVFGTLGAATSFEDCEDGFLGERLIREFAHCAVEADGFGNVH